MDQTGTVKSGLSPTAKVQTGSVLVEFTLMASVVLVLFPLILQLGLVYHAKLVLNYAVFEAARKGAVNNASVSAMRDELGIRLAPIHGGDGSAEAALVAVAKSTLATLDASSTQITILNPTPAAFKDWGVLDQASGRRIIPNAHLRHQSDTVGLRSGVNLQDANLLKLQVTHGINLQVPLAGSLIARVMRTLDPSSIGFYIRRKFPLTSVATVRMQSDAWETEILNADSSSPPPMSPPPTMSTSVGHDHPDSTWQTTESIGGVASEPSDISVADSTESAQVIGLATDGLTVEATDAPGEALSSTAIADAGPVATSPSDSASAEQSGGDAWGHTDECQQTNADRSDRPMLVSAADYQNYLNQHQP